MTLYEELGIISVEQLLEAVHQERLRDLKGFGERTEDNILHGISLLQKAGGGRILIGAAMDAAEQLVAELSVVRGCVRCTYAGSLRRMRAVTDHAPDLAVQRMTREKILAQRERVRELDGRHHRMWLLHGTERNIGPDGSLDWPDEFLADFDLCVASVHSHFNQSRHELTRRLIRACENPHVAVIGHPTTRRIGERPGIDADFDAVFADAASAGAPAAPASRYPVSGRSRTS